jgi:hydrogenase maturation protease
MILCMAIGNTLRGDDAVAHRTLSLLTPNDQVRSLDVLQLTPELASEIAAADVVVFLDADPSAVKATLIPIEPHRGSTPIAHSMGPAEVVAIARRLYAFAGEAFLCRIPAMHLAHGEGLTPQAETAAQSAAKLIEENLRRLEGSGGCTGWG